MICQFRDGHRERWWAAGPTVIGLGWDRPHRLVGMTTDPARLPAKSIWYLLTNLPHPAAPQSAPSSLPPADLSEITRLYGLRTCVEQGSTHVKQALGLAD